MAIKIVQLTDNEQIKDRTLRAAIYARYSTKGNSPYSSDEQILRIRHRVETGSIRSKRYPDAKVVVEEDWVVKDEAQSGRVPREGYELIKQGAILGRKVDIVLMDDIARMTRDMGETIDLYEALAFTRVEGISVSDNISTVDENSRDLFIFKGYANEHLARQTSKNTIRGLEVRALGGFSTGHICYGYYSTPTRTAFVKGVEKPSHFEIHIKDEEAAVVVRIWSLFANGHGQNDIASILNDEGVSPPRGKGTNGLECSRWPSKTIWNILTNAKYCGQWRYRMTRMVKNPGTGNYVQVPRPPEEWIMSLREDLRIIHPELEQQVKAHRNAIQRSRAAATTPEAKVFSNIGGQPKHILIGTMICGRCGANMIQVSGRHGGYLGCMSTHRQSTLTCDNSQKVRMDLVEDRVFAALREHLDRPETYQAIAKRYNELMGQQHGDLPAQCARIEAEIIRVEKKLANYRRFIAEGHWSETVTADLVTSEQQLKSLNAELEQLRRRSTNQIYITPMAIRERLTNLGDLLAMKVVEANKILRRVFPEKIVLVPVAEGKRKYYRAKAALNLGGMFRCDSVVGGVP